MNKKEKLVIYLIFLLLYLIFATYNLVGGSQWIIDNVVGIALLTFVFFVNKWLKMGKLGFILFNVALLTHNLGTFGFYSWSWKIFAYDNVVHLLSSLVGAYILFNFVSRKLHIRKNQRVKETVIDEHKAIVIFLVIASVAMLGTIVELIEFVGFMFLGPGEGMFFFGTGDSGNTEDVAGQYIDTMTDIIVNTLGSILGVVLYYYHKYRKQPWLRY
jgi:uncharacterized membrane protein YjdF